MKKQATANKEPNTTAAQLDALEVLPDILNTTEKQEGKIVMNNVVSIPMADKLEELRQNAATAKHALSVAAQTDSMKAVADAKKDADKAATAYNDFVLERLFDSFLTQDMPMQAAIHQGFYKKMTITVQETKEGQSANIKMTDTVISIPRFLRYAGTRQIAAASDWLEQLETVTFQFAIRATQDIGGDVSAMLADYDLSEKARGIVNKEVKPRASSPISNTTLIAKLQAVLDALIPENTLKLTSHDLMYFLYTSFRKGKTRGQVAMPRLQTMVERMTEVAHVRMHNLKYSAEYKTIERKEAAAA